MIAAPHLRSNARHRPDEILDHPIGIGMIHVEAVQLAVGGQIDARLALDIEHYARGIQPRLIRARPNRRRVRHERPDVERARIGRRGRARARELHARGHRDLVDDEQRPDK